MKPYHPITVSLLLFLLSVTILWGQTSVSEHHLPWKSSLYVPSIGGKDAVLYFDGCVNLNSFQELPCYTYSLGYTKPFSKSGTKTLNKLYLSNPHYREALAFETVFLDKYAHLIGSDFLLESIQQEYKHQYQLQAQLLPIRKNSETGKYELLTDFEILFTTNEREPSLSTTINTYKEKAQPTSSVLSQGKTLKIGINISGMYQITYQNLVEQGLINQAIPSTKLALYGNKAGMLPRYNIDGIYDDLRALPILLYDGQDGVFGPGDYFVFYGESPHTWTYTGNKKAPFQHQIHLYSDLNYYFVGVNENQTPVRIEKEAAPAIVPQNDLSQFLDYQHYENDLVNICNGSMNWFGESFQNNGESKTFPFYLPDAVFAGESNQKAIILLQVAGNNANYANAYFNINIENNAHSISIPSHSSSNCAIMNHQSFTQDLFSTSLPIKLTYYKSGSATNGYLDFISIFYPRYLKLYKGELRFRAGDTLHSPTRFLLSKANSHTKILNVSDIYHTHELTTSFAENTATMSFACSPSDWQNEYIAFDGSSYHSPAFIGITNIQNLHGQGNIDYAIVTHPNFLQQAEKIAELHRTRNAYNTVVATTEQVYNEFSSGVQDPSAIRLFMKMFYDRADKADRTEVNTTETSIENSTETNLSKAPYLGPSYLLLFGKASYDYRNRNSKQSNFVPTFELFDLYKEGGESPLEDNFAYLGDGEGASNSLYYTQPYQIGLMDIAVGRLPVSTKQEAENVLKKIEIYSSPTYLFDKNRPETGGNLGNWRNDITFITDDGFESDMESTSYLAKIIEKDYPTANIEKLYADAYERVATAVTSTFPLLRENIKLRMDKGGFFVGYLGHSGWEAWGDERHLTLDDISKWAPNYAFPMMASSSCSFAYFDQVDKISGAEQAVLHPHGGAISMLATSRTAYSGGIERIQSDFISHAMDKSSKKMPTIGDAYLQAKINNKNNEAYRFILLGDPGLPSALPKYNVNTLTINGKSVKEAVVDTFKAFSTITIEGEIQKRDGSVFSDFNGLIFTKIFDKATKETTKGQYDPHSNTVNEKVTYSIQQNMLYNGQNQVTNGKFMLTFIVPKDIAYNYGPGKISYYAYSDSLGDANGYFNNFIVGGSDPNAIIDTTAPIVKLYLNRDNFINGSTVGNMPYLYAEISDKFGINTTGSGIGHDMTLIVDGKNKEPLIANNLFQYNTGSYNAGTLLYPLDLANGKHSIELKVWNIYNISTTAILNFEINSSNRFEVYQFIATPNPIGSTGYTDFYFSHNGIGGGISYCELSIYSLSGSLITTLRYDISDASGYSIGPLRWNGNAGNRGNLEKGFYIGRMRIYNKNGDRVEKGIKLIIANKK
ncbi:MAG: type IX secretion system sortase PorU [Bacteroidales bacterium]